MKRIGIPFVVMLLAVCIRLNAQTLPTKEEVKSLLNLVNGYWQKTNSPEQWSFWDIASYHTGNMEAYKITKNQTYLAYSERWAEHNQWKGAKSTNKSEWKYDYGETDDHVLFGDWQICFQTYLDLNAISPNERKVARAKEVMSYQVSTPNSDYWWWADGLYMVMPVMTKMFHLTGDSIYLEKLHSYFEYANSIMFDKEVGLYYRDAKYVFPKHKSNNGGKDFWARGDGWVFAGLAKVLQDLPNTDEFRQEYIQKFKGMALAIKESQQAQGYWTRSILDKDHAPGPETSGTAFFTYGLFWGINHGLLNREEYLPTALRAWEYLSTVAVQKNGHLGYVQPIGERAIPGQVVDKNATAPFGVGAFLLAASELYRLLDLRR